MVATQTRIMKEARAVFWPWCAVAISGIAGIMTAVPYQPRFSVFPLAEEILPFIISMGFWVGIPALATLVFGNEFQHRTLPLMLSQPISRIKMWREKWIVVITATFSA